MILPYLRVQMFELHLAAADADIRRGRFAEKYLTVAFRSPFPPRYFSIHLSSGF